MPLYRHHQKYTSRKYYYSRCPWTPVPPLSRRVLEQATEGCYEIAGGNSILHLRHVRPQHVLGPAARLTKAP